MNLKDFHPELDDTCVPDDESIVEVKSTTTYEYYKDVARKVIEHLIRMSKKNQKNYTETERELTSSFVKSVLLGLGNSDPKLSAELVKVGEFAYKYKKVRSKF